MIEPSLEGLKHYPAPEDTQKPTLIPICASCGLADHITPSLAYSRLQSSNTGYSFLLESVVNSDKLGRYSYVGSNITKTLESDNVDPLNELERELTSFNFVKNEKFPPLQGGAIGFIGYDCIQYFEPKTRRENMRDELGLPEAKHFLTDWVIAFDHIFQTVKIIYLLRLPSNYSYQDVQKQYNLALKHIESIRSEIFSKEPLTFPPQEPVIPNEFTSKQLLGREGYISYVQTMKKHILKGDIIQAVPSHRVERETKLHPFNIYRFLRTVNPSPYMFYLDYKDFKVIGASPEVLVRFDEDRIITHPIAGTVRRGETVDEDERLCEELLESAKDRAEHVMLVDLARNDVNRVCDYASTRVDIFMTIQKFSHVSHLVSQVSGVLRKDKTRFDAFRSIFPAGTVSGAPKVRAMELIAETENVKRGVYAGAVGVWGYDARSMDTCIALRTMVWKDGKAYLQAGGGIVYDSVEEDEYVETVNKMGANERTIQVAEAFFGQQ